MLLDLNQDCVEEIFKYINLTDHLILTQTNPILKGIIKKKFKRKFKPRSQITAYWQKENNDINIPSYLDYIINNQTESIKCDIYEMSKIQEALRGLEFIRVNSITFDAKNLKRRLSFELKNLIRFLFPNLKTLKVKGFVNGKFNFLSDKIETIEICSRPRGSAWRLLNNRKLKKIVFHEPFRNLLKFKKVFIPTQLEELKLCFSDHASLLECFKYNHLMNLRKLTIKKVTEEIELSIDEEHFYRSIDSIAFNTQNCPSLVTKFVNLQSLLFVNDNGNTLKEFCKLDIKEWNKLEKIHYLKTSNDSDVEVQKTNLLYMVRHCPLLEMLDISGSKFDVDFIKSLTEVLASQSRRRKLLVYCFNTKIPKDLMCPEIIFSFQELNYELPDEQEIQIELNEEKSIAEIICYVQQLIDIFKARICDPDIYEEVFRPMEWYFDETKKDYSMIKDKSYATFGIWSENLPALRDRMFTMRYELEDTIKALLEGVSFREMID